MRLLRKTGQVLTICFALPALGCGSSEDSAPQTPHAGAACDTTRRPLVFVHGTVGSGDNFSHPALLLASNGYCADRIHAIEYNSLGGGYADAAAKLDELIPKVLAETHADKVDLLGHSQGAGHGVRYAGEHPDRIAHYIHLAGGPVAENPGGVPTLSIASTGDAIAKGCCDNTSISKSVVFQDVNIDHFAVAASTESFIEIYKFLNDGKEPAHLEVEPEDQITLYGRGITFGDSQIVEGATIEVYELGSDARQRGAPVQSFNVPADGFVGPWLALAGVAYEFKLIAPAGDTRLPRHFYPRPFKRSNRLLRFLFQSQNTLASNSTNAVNYSDEHAVFVARHSRGAFLFGRDELSVDGFQALNDQNAIPANTVVGLYMFDNSLTAEDGPGNGVSEGGAAIKGAFVSSSDVFIPAITPAFSIVKYNDQELKVPNWPSASDGLSILFFD